MDEEQICEEQTFDEQLMELNVVERESCVARPMSYAGPGQVDDTLACDVDLGNRCACSLHLSHHVELHEKGTEIVGATMRTMGTQSQTTYTALARHATPRFTVLPDQMHGSFDEGGRRSWGSQARTLTPRTTRIPT